MQRILMQYGREQVRFHPTESQGKRLIGGQGRVHGDRAGFMVERQAQWWVRKTPWWAEQTLWLAGQVQW